MQDEEDFEGKTVKVQKYRGCREAVELYQTLRPKILEFWPAAPHMVEISAGPDDPQAHSLSEADFEETEEEKMRQEEEEE